ncbi:MAG: tyrosine-type recombinase/integrase [Hydrogenovibrio sp.]
MFQTLTIDDFNFGVTEGFVAMFHLNGIFPLYASCYLLDVARTTESKDTVETFCSAIKKYYQFLLSSNNSDSTDLDSTKRVIEYIESKVLEVDRNLVESYVEYLIEELDHKGSSCRQALINLQGFYRFLANTGVTKYQKVTKNTCKGLVRNSKKQFGITTQVRNQYILPSLFKKVLLDQRWTDSTFKQKRNELALKLRYETGLRSHELVSHDNFEVSKIKKLLKNTNASSALKLIVLGKGNKAREILIPPDLVTLLKTYITKELKGYAKGCIFTTGGKVKKPLKTYSFHDEAINQSIKFYLKNNYDLSEKERKDWLQKTPYGLRHSFATNKTIELMIQGLPYQQLLADLMGHDSPETTLNYIHFSSTCILSESSAYEEVKAQLGGIEADKLVVLGIQTKVSQEIKKFAKRTAL